MRPVIANVRFARYRWASGQIPVGSVLDAACGDGMGSFYLSSLGCRVLGVDSTPRFIHCAERLFWPVHDPGRPPAFMMADLQRGEWLDAFVDFGSVICLEAIEHLPKPEKALRHFARSLVPGGRLVLTTPNEEVYPFRTWTDDGDGSPHLRHYRTDEITNLLESNGFHVKQMWTQPGRMVFSGDRWKKADLGDWREGSDGLFLGLVADKR